jgi:hypothetical protein
LDPLVLRDGQRPLGALRQVAGGSATAAIIATTDAKASWDDAERAFS